MISFLIFLVLVIVGAIWSLLSGSHFRKPIFLVILGVSVGILGACIAYAIGCIGTNENLKNIFPDYKLGRDIVTVLVSSLSGSLIVSGIVIRTERLHASDILAANNKITRAKEFQRIAKNNDEELKEIASSLSPEDFFERYHAIRQQEIKALEKLIEAEESIKKIKL
jgi:hypothetical protein